MLPAPVQDLLNADTVQFPPDSELRRHVSIRLEMGSILVEGAQSKLPPESAVGLYTVRVNAEELVHRSGGCIC